MAGRTGKGSRNNLHLVARCPFCARAVWMKRIVALLGIDTLARGRLELDEVAFFAETTHGKKGWKHAASSHSAAELESAAGGEAVAQLRKLCRLAVNRMFMFGLLDKNELIDIARTDSLDVKRKKAPALDFATYSPAKVPNRPMTTESYSP